jgi:MFS family permease
MGLLFPAFATGNLKFMMVLFALGATTITMPGPQLFAILADVVHPELRGRTAAASSLVNAISTAASPLTFGLLSDWIGLRSAFLLLVPLMGIGGTLLLFLGPRFLSVDLQRMRTHLSGAQPPTAPHPDPDTSHIEPGCPQQHPAATRWSGANRGDSLLVVTFDLLCLLGVLTSLALAVTEASR